MKYYKVIIPTENIDETVAELTLMDITSVEIDDPADLQDIIENQKQLHWDFVDPSLVETGKSKTPTVSAYFEEPGDAEKTAEMFPGSSVEISDDAEWKDKYKEHFKSLALTDEILVVPSWEEAPLDGRKIIDLDPGMAFGTGAHQTTAMCARLMDKYGCRDKKILDVGTGSGILAIAACLMGSTCVMGTDIDETAVEVAVENVEKNGLSDYVTIEMRDLADGVDFKADIVVANIVAELVIKLAADIKDHLVKGGQFICSGILKEKEEMVKEALEELGFVIDDVCTDGDWCAIGARYE